MKTPTTFKPGQKLSASSICDSECIYTATVIKRTEKMVTIEEHGKQKTIKVHADSYGEHCYPHGHYSMCAIFRAPAVVAPLPEWMEEIDEAREAAPFAQASPEPAPEPENVVLFQRPAAPAENVPSGYTPAVGPNGAHMGLHRGELLSPSRPVYEDKPRSFTQQRMVFDESDLFALR